MPQKRPLERGEDSDLIKKRKPNITARRAEQATLDEADTINSSNMDVDMEPESTQVVASTPEPAMMTTLSSYPGNVMFPGPDRTIAPADATEINTKPDIKGSNILPAHLAHLTKKYSFAIVAIKSHSKINSKVKAMIQHMSRFDFMDLTIKPGVVALDAGASDASKLITTIEILKKDIFENNRSGKWYQYNRVASELVQIPRKFSKMDMPVRGRAPAQDDEDAMDLGALSIADAAASATNNQVNTDTKSRAMPMMTIYMSRVPVPELRQEFGEQNNEEDIVKWWEPLS